MNFLPENIYKICLENIPIVSVDVVIFNEAQDQVLLFKRTNNPLKGEYYTIGGRVLKNECLIDTAIRKLRDEAGVVISQEELSFGGFMEEFYEDSIYPGIDTHNINIYFSYIVSSERYFELDSQHSEMKWFDVRSDSVHWHIRKKLSTIYDNYLRPGELSVCQSKG